MKFTVTDRKRIKEEILAAKHTEEMPLLTCAFIVKLIEDGMDESQEVDFCARYGLYEKNKPSNLAKQIYKCVLEYRNRLDIAIKTNSLCEYVYLDKSTLNELKHNFLNPKTIVPYEKQRIFRDYLRTPNARYIANKYSVKEHTVNCWLRSDTYNRFLSEC
jgi:predicted esterase YcpF (UPF0227 family)